MTTINTYTILSTIYYLYYLLSTLYYLLSTIYYQYLIVGYCSPRVAGWTRCVRLFVCSKKTLNASIPSEHPPVVQRKKLSISTSHGLKFYVNYSLSWSVLICSIEEPTGRGHKMAQNGWKLNKVEKIGSTRPFLVKKGRNGCWPIGYGQQHSLSFSYSGAPAFRQKSTGSSRFWHYPLFFTGSLEQSFCKSMDEFV